MPALFFTNTFMMAALSALAVPVLIHLLLKRRKKRVQFSTVRFFQQQDEQSSRRRKLRNWFLLALRLLIVSLLVLAFSRPYTRQNQAAAGSGNQRRVVFVLDRSASMLGAGVGGQRWALAKEQIQKTLAELSPDDVAAVVECATHASVLSGFAPAAQVSQLVRALGPAYGSSDLGEGLREAVRLLSDRAVPTGSSIVLVSDFQKSACRRLGAVPVPQSIELRLVPVADVLAPNTAIIGMETEQRDNVRPRMSIASFSDEETTAVTVEVRVDGQRLSSETLSLRAGEVTNCDLRIPRQKPGWHDVQALLSSKDALEADNVRCGCLWVPQPAKVLLVEPLPSARVFDRATFFLSSALDPTTDPTNQVPGAFEIAQTSPEQLASHLASGKGKQDWDMVVLPALKELPFGIGKELGAFVRSGGGVVLFSGDGMSVNRYNSELGDLLPAQLGAADASADINSPWRIALYDTNCVAFAAFRLPNSGDLRIPQFTQRYSLEATAGATRLAFFDDGIPLLLEKPVGAGKVLLVNTSADTGWSDWPKHKTFVPFLHGLARLAARNSIDESVHATESYTAGEGAELELGAQAKSSQFKLVKPDGKPVQLATDELGRVRDADLSTPGIYSLQNKAGEEVRRLAVNLPAEESNLESLRATEAQQSMVRSQENPKQTLAAGLFGARNDQRELWAALLLAGLVLLLVEPFVANRTSA